MSTIDHIEISMIPEMTIIADGATELPIQVEANVDPIIDHHSSQHTSLIGDKNGQQVIDNEIIQNIDDGYNKRSSLMMAMDVLTRTSSVIQDTELEKQIKSSLWKAYFLCSIPPLITQLSTSILLFINGYIISSYLGTIGLSCQSYSAPTDYLVRGIAQILSSGSIAVLSSLIGSGASKLLRDLTIATIFWSNIVISIICIGLYSLILRPIYDIGGGSGPILQGAIEYSQVYIYVIPCYMFFMTFTSTLLAEGLSKYNMCVSVVATSLGTLFTYLFLAYTNIGISGASLGPGMAVGIGAILCMLLYIFNFTTVKLRPMLLFSNKKQGLLLLSKMVKLGSGSAIIYFAYAFILLLFNYLVNKAVDNPDEIDLAFSASGGISKLYSMFTSFYLAFGSYGYLPIASFFVGRGNKRELLSFTNWVIVIIIVICGVLTALVLGLQHYIGLIFSSSQRFSEYFSVSVYWSYSTAILAAFQFLSISFGQSLNLSRRVMIVSILCLCLYQPLGMVICYFIFHSFVSLMMSYCVNDVLSFFTCIALMYQPYTKLEYYIDQYFLELRSISHKNDADNAVVPPSNGGAENTLNIPQKTGVNDPNNIQVPN